VETLCVILVILICALDSLIYWRKHKRWVKGAEETDETEETAPDEEGDKH
jgi:hypothetical protein